MSDNRTYLDYNSTSPLTESSKRAMLEVIELVGNASSIHAEGRKVKGIVENKGCPKIEKEEEEILKRAFDNLEFEGVSTLIKN